MANLDALFEQWLEGKVLTDTEMSALHQDEHFATMMQEASKWQAHASNYQDEAVPHWDRASTFCAQDANSLRLWWPQAIAASVSIVALLGSVLLWQQNVMLKEQLQAQQQQGMQTQQQLASLVTQLDGLQRQQNSQLLEAVQHVLTTSRDERREDMGMLMEYWKTQRAQDNALFKIQLNDLAEQVEFLPPSRVAKLEEQ